MTRYLRFFVIFAMALFLSSCASVKGLKNFATSNFSFNSVSNIRLSGVDIDDVKNYKSLTLPKATKILSSFMSNSLELALNVNLDIRNPHDEVAKFNGMDYILWIDDMQVLAGSLNQNITVEPKTKAFVPVSFSVNLKDLLKGKSRDMVLDYGFGLATNKEQSSRVKLSFKPYLRLGTKQIKFPAYITVGGDKLMPKK